LDISLPGQDGFAVAAAIAAAYPAVRIVLTSSDTEHVPGAVLKTCGATAFVPKTELATADLETLLHGAALES
jgi:DNA-binding NarL/FixJ family response regulator